MADLENRVVVITGAASGIGRAAAEMFAARGAGVALWDINDALGTETELLLRQKGYNAFFRKVNTASRAEVDQAAVDTIHHLGHADILINNAGVTRDASLAKMTEDQWQQVIDVNLTGVFHCTQVLTESMMQRQWGRIINTTSIVALYGNYGQTNYAASKAGLIGMTKTWARELGRYNITVNAVAPGFIATEMIKTIPDKVIAQMTEKVPLKKLGTPEDVAAVYAFLASDAAQFISGAVISVDGGLTI